MILPGIEAVASRHTRSPSYYVYTTPFLLGTGPRTRRGLVIWDATTGEVR